MNRVWLFISSWWIDTPTAALTFQIELNDDGSIYNYHIYPSVVKNVQRMTYQSVQQYLTEYNTKNHKPIDIHLPSNTTISIDTTKQYLYSNNYQSLFPQQKEDAPMMSTEKNKDLQTMLISLYESALKRKRYREERGALDYSIPQIDVHLKENEINSSIGKEFTYSDVCLVWRGSNGIGAVDRQGDDGPGWRSRRSVWTRICIFSFCSWPSTSIFLCPIVIRTSICDICLRTCCLWKYLYCFLLGWFLYSLYTLYSQYSLPNYLYEHMILTMSPPAGLTSSFVPRKHESLGIDSYVQVFPFLCLLL